jgi:hypothetical protein
LAEIGSLPVPKTPLEQCPKHHWEMGVWGTGEMNFEADWIFYGYVLQAAISSRHCRQPQNLTSTRMFSDGTHFSRGHVPGGKTRSEITRVGGVRERMPRHNCYLRTIADIGQMTGCRETHDE